MTLRREPLPASHCLQTHPSPRTNLPTNLAGSPWRDGGRGDENARGGGDEGGGGQSRDEEGEEEWGLSIAEQGRQLCEAAAALHEVCVCVCVCVCVREREVRVSVRVCVQRDQREMELRTHTRELRTHTRLRARSRSLSHTHTHTHTSRWQRGTRTGHNNSKHSYRCC